MISVLTIQLLEQYKSLLAQSVRVHPVCPKEPEPQDFLRQILESSGSILKDLTDEDEATCD